MMKSDKHWPAWQEVQRRLIGSPPSKRQITSHLNSCGCICVVKDEAPYIHEYIHHHLYFGFSRVQVLVNRTTDKTAEILDRISRRYPQVVASNIDWIDALGYPAQIQKLGYAYGIGMARAAASVQYVLLNDADEFWFPLDFETKIYEFLDKYPRFDTISFCWARQLSPEPPFAAPFRNQLVDISPLVKSIINLSSELSAVRLHVADIQGGGRRLVADGSSLIPKGNNYNVYGGNSMSHTAYILHRMQRSEPEYFATLMRGRPCQSGLKDNRKGYLSVANRHLEISAAMLERYYNSLESFVQDCRIRTLVDESRAIRLEKAINVQDFLSQIVTEPSSDSKKAKIQKLLRGTRLDAETNR